MAMRIYEDRSSAPNLRGSEAQRLERMSARERTTDNLADSEFRAMEAPDDD